MAQGRNFGLKGFQRFFANVAVDVVRPAGFSAGGRGTRFCSRRMTGSGKGFGFCHSAAPAGVLMQTCTSAGWFGDGFPFAPIMAQNGNGFRCAADFRSTGFAVNDRFSAALSRAGRAGAD